MLVRRQWLQCLGGGLMLACGISTEAAPLVYFDEDGGNGNPRGLYNFDTGTSISTLRTTVPGFERFFSIDIRPSDGTAFTLSLSPTAGLFTIDLNTGSYSLIGLTGVSDLVGLAFDPMTSQLFGLKNNGGLYSVNQLTGEATLIGDTGPVQRGLVFSPSRELFGFTDLGRLYRIDPATGGVTPVGGSGNTVPNISEDAAFTAAGELYATDFGGTIYRTDPVTGNGAIVGSTGMGPGLFGLVAVPEPSTFVLFVCGASLIAISFRRKSTN